MESGELLNPSASDLIVRVTNSVQSVEFCQEGLNVFPNNSMSQTPESRELPNSTIVIQECLKDIKYLFTDSVLIF